MKISFLSLCEFHTHYVVYSDLYPPLRPKLLCDWFYITRGYIKLSGCVKNRNRDFVHEQIGKEEFR